MAGFLDAVRKILEGRRQATSREGIVQRARDRGLFTSKARAMTRQLIRSITSTSNEVATQGIWSCLGRATTAWKIGAPVGVTRRLPKRPVATITSTNNGCATGYHFGEAGAHPSGHARR